MPPAWDHTRLRRVLTPILEDAVAVRADGPSVQKEALGDLPVGQSFGCEGGDLRRQGGGRAGVGVRGATPPAGSDRTSTNSMQLLGAAALVLGDFRCNAATWTALRTPAAARAGGGSCP